MREAWMSILGASIEDSRVLDLFAGSGALGLEALSRGAESVVFVERARAATKALEENVASLGAGRDCTIVRADALSYVARLAPGTFDLVLADPPYGKGFAERLLSAFHSGPFAQELWVEHRSTEVLPEFSGLKQRSYGDTTLSTLQVDP